MAFSVVVEFMGPAFAEIEQESRASMQKWPRFGVSAMNLSARVTIAQCQRRINSPQKWHLKIPQFS